MVHHIIHKFFDVISPMSMLILKLFKSIIKSNHSGFHFADTTFCHIFELVYFLNGLILPFCHQIYFISHAFLELRKLVDPFDYLSVNSPL